MKYRKVKAMTEEPQGRKPKSNHHLILLTSKLEIVVVAADSREAARAADLLIRGEDKEKGEAGEPRKLIGSWLVHLPTGNVVEAYGFRCKGVDPEEYGYVRGQEPQGHIDDPKFKP
jgi:hypothetical protein